MRRKNATTPEEQEEFAELYLDNIFRCQCCNKFKNKNRMKKVIGFATWRTCAVCDKCFAELDLAEVL